MSITIVFFRSLVGATFTLLHLNYFPKRTKGIVPRLLIFIQLPLDEVIPIFSGYNAYILYYSLFFVKIYLI
ncbi:hypothetical protein SBF1_160012 [Candidatus Desulfosporosinus infrequens]|uniref:Uncharacterized protein n=1 Tax=Candidatus Desulfosporosinus infrequens TaxID=2043169 RepID=A0A2U3K9K9_9FIRM|nr:hypothetical protein SBF1_160012 [Candidatus Desulfosporosinus infrequens]